MKKIMTVVGARPQIIKSAAISRCIQRAYASSLNEVVLHTGQHYSDQLSALHYNQMGLRQPDVILSPAVHDSAVKRMTDMTSKIADSISDHKPDIVLVYGDTDSTLAAALAANMMGVKIAHVEAGLRSHRSDMPEERNRILTDQVSDYLFAPTAQATRQLQYELRDRQVTIVQSGDVMLDNALYYKAQAQKPVGLTALAESFVLFTAHRAATMDDRATFMQMLACVEELLKHSNVVWPMHPRAHAQLERYLGADQAKEWLNQTHLFCIEPIGYLDTLWCLAHASLVCTDSGGLQKEAAFFGKPVLILRDETEWNELVENGIAVLIGTNASLLKNALLQLSQTDGSLIASLFGSGQAADVICQTLIGKTAS